MKTTDAAADPYTWLWNPSPARHRVVEVPASNLKKEITKRMCGTGPNLKDKFEDTGNKQGNIRIALKYNPETRESAINKLQRVSSPGLRQYNPSTELPKVLK